MKKFGKLLKDNAVFIILLVLIVGFFSVFFFNKVDGESMTNTLPDGKILFCTRLGTPKVGDIIVCDITAELEGGKVKDRYRYHPEMIAVADPTKPPEKNPDGTDVPGTGGIKLRPHFNIFNM